MTLLVELVRIDIAVLRDCRVGERVTVRWERDPILVTVPSGIPVGEVGAADAAAVRQRRSRVGRVVACDVENARCAVEI